MKYLSSPGSKPRRKFIRRLSLAFIIGMISAFSMVAASAASEFEAQETQLTPTSPPQPTPTIAPAIRLAKPPMIPNITNQANRGAQKYWGVCMACHGDHGQGLTDEWRSVYGEDSNCWASGCHGKDHPPQGFEIPKTLTIPALAGPGRLGRFANAQQLYDYIYANMPWWKPGFLSSEEAWAVTTQLLRMNNAWPQNLVLDSTNASAVSVHYLAVDRREDKTAIWMLVGVLTLAGAGLTLQSALTCKRSAVETATRSRRANFFHHLHPPTIPAMQARWRYTLGAGGLAIFLCLILLVTGVLEMFYYSPTPEKAAISVEAITSLAPFGHLIRGLHFWSAQALVIVAAIHLLRVILTGAHVGRRRLNFLIGLGMFVLILMLDFTGYVLRWDEGIRWALVVGTNLLQTIPLLGEKLYYFIVGGSEIVSGTLIRFYTWHIFALTLGAIILGAWHIFRIRRDGGVAVAPPAQRDEKRRITRFELVNREVLAMTAAGIVLLILATLIAAPIAPPILNLDTANQINSARAPWFFLWVQQLLKLGDPFLWGIVVPALLLLVLALTPFIFPAPDESQLGRWLPRGGRLAQIAAVGIVAAITALTILSILSPNTTP